MRGVVKGRRLPTEAEGRVPPCVIPRFTGGRFGNGRPADLPPPRLCRAPYRDYSVPWFAENRYVYAVPVALLCRA